MKQCHRPLEDVLEEVIRRERVPDAKALDQWATRYPDHADALAELFTIWSVQLFMNDPEAPTTALERFRRKGVIPREEKVELLGDFDRLVLTAIAGFDGQAHTGNVAQKVQQETGKDVPRKSILNAADGLEKRGLLWSRTRDPKTHADEKGPKYFGVTAAGARALARPDLVNPDNIERAAAALEAYDEVDENAEDFNFEECLPDIWMSETVPTYEAIVKWCNIYPQYRTKMADRLLGWALGQLRGDEPQELIPLSDEDRVMGRFDQPDAEEYTLELLREIGRPMPPPPIRKLQSFDRYVLEAIQMLAEKATAPNITERLAVRTRTPVLPTATITSLDRLEKLGLVIHWVGATPSYFKLSIGGKLALTGASPLRLDQRI